MMWSPVIDFVAAGYNYLHPYLRRPRLADLIRVPMSWLTQLNAKTVYEMGFTGQIASLERWLNDSYDMQYSNVSREADIATASIIYIENVADVDITYVYNQIEAFPPYYIFNYSEEEDPVYLVNASECAVGVDFIVRVPVGVAFSIPVIRAQVNKYKIAGKRFIVLTYS